MVKRNCCIKYKDPTERRASFFSENVWRLKTKATGRLWFQKKSYEEQENRSSCNVLRLKNIYVYYAKTSQVRIYDDKTEDIWQIPTNNKEPLDSISKKEKWDK